MRSGWDLAPDTRDVRPGRPDPVCSCDFPGGPGPYCKAHRAWVDHLTDDRALLLRVNA